MPVHFIGRILRAVRQKIDIVFGENLLLCHKAPHAVHWKRRRIAILAEEHRILQPGHMISAIVGMRIPFRASLANRPPYGLEENKTAWIQRLAQPGKIQEEC